MRIVSHTIGGRPDGHGAHEPDAPRGADPRGGRGRRPARALGLRGRGGALPARGSAARRRAVGSRVSYLLDTTVLADFANGSHGARELVEELFAATGDLYTCEAVSCEALSGGGEIERMAVRKLLDALEFVALDPGGARYAGDLRRAAGRTSGRTLGDALMAALAWRIAATIVTRNGRDFEPYGVKVREYGASAS